MSVASLFWFPNISVGICGVALAVVGSIVSVLEFKGWRRIVLAGVFLLLGVGEVIAIRQADTAHVREIKETAQQVAAETSTRVSADVTKAVTEQFNQTVADQKAKIDALQAKLDKQSRDVAVIKGSNIVTGKNPVKVEVTNEQASSKIFQVENIRILVEPEASSHTDAPYAQKVTMQADAPINPLRLAIFCDGPLKYGELGARTESGFYNTNNRVSESDKSVFIINMVSQIAPLLRPDMPIVFHLYSERPIKVLKFERGPP